MPYHDLREWIHYLEENGELQRVQKEVDWNLEAGAITRRVYDLEGPAVLFENLKDYPPGFRILGAPMSLSKRNKYARLASALDMPLDSDIRALTEDYLVKKKRRIPPRLVSEAEAPCQQNQLLGDDIDLLKLPVPMIHDGDGGRYLGTWHTVVTKDPDSDWVNYGMYRNQVYSRNKLGVPGIPLEHIGMHYLAAKRQGKPLEVAVVMGTEPLTAMISATNVPAGVNEVDVIGGLRGEPLDVVQCKTVNLQVPAGSEIVVEGYIDIEDRHPEGPFGEYTGFMTRGAANWLAITVTAITYRDDPILPMSCMGVPVDDSAVTSLFAAGAEMLDELREKGLPVDFVCLPHYGTAHICAISLKQIPYKAFPRTVAMAAWATKYGAVFGTILLLVNDDVDVTDPNQVMWAMATRVHPSRGSWLIEDTVGVPLAPYLSPTEREQMTGPRVMLDGTWPTDWPEEDIPIVSSFTTIWPKKIQEKVLANWKDYGFD